MASGQKKDSLNPGHAFISYSREDSANVDWLHQALESAGIPVWRDTTSLWPGDDWKVKIREAITDNALVFIACYSSGSTARRRGHRNEELILAVEELRRRRPDDPWLIPVRFDDCEIPDFELGAGRTLSSIHRADLFGHNIGQATERLTAAIRRLLPDDTQAPAGSDDYAQVSSRVSAELEVADGITRSAKRLIARKSLDHAAEVINVAIGRYRVLMENEDGSLASHAPIVGLHLAEALAVQAQCLLDNGDAVAAVPPMEEAMRMHLFRYQAEGSDYSAKVYADSLLDLSIILARLGRYNEAAGGTVRAIELLVHCADANEPVVQPKLARLMSNAAALLHQAGQTDPAFEFSRMSLSLYAGMAEEDRHDARGEEMTAFINLGIMLRESGSLKQSFVALKVAETLAQELSDTNKLRKIRVDLAGLFQEGLTREESEEAELSSQDLRRLEDPDEREFP